MWGGGGEQRSDARIVFGTEFGRGPNRRRKCPAFRKKRTQCATKAPKWVGAACRRRAGGEPTPVCCCAAAGTACHLRRCGQRALEDQMPLVPSESSGAVMVLGGSQPSLWYKAGLPPGRRTPWKALRPLPTRSAERRGRGAICSRGGRGMPQCRVYISTAQRQWRTAWPATMRSHSRCLPVAHRHHLNVICDLLRPSPASYSYPPDDIHQSMGVSHPLCDIPSGVWRQPSPPPPPLLCDGQPCWPLLSGPNGPPTGFNLRKSRPCRLPNRQ